MIECPVHRTPMKKSTKPDEYYCTQKTVTGWCKEIYKEAPDFLRSNQVPAPASVKPDTFGEILGTQGIFQAMIASGKLDFTNLIAGDEAIALAHRYTKAIRSYVNDPVPHDGLAGIGEDW